MPITLKASEETLNELDSVLEKPTAFPSVRFFYYSHRTHFTSDTSAHLRCGGLLHTKQFCVTPAGCPIF